MSNENASEVPTFIIPSYAFAAPGEKPKDAEKYFRISEVSGEEAERVAKSFQSCYEATRNLRVLDTCGRRSRLRRRQAREYGSHLATAQAALPTPRRSVCWLLETKVQLTDWIDDSLFATVEVSAIKESKKRPRWTSGKSVRVGAGE